jgi:hypothetical protein
VAIDLCLFLKQLLGMYGFRYRQRQSTSDESEAVAVLTLISILKMFHLRLMGGAVSGVLGD